MRMSRSSIAWDVSSDFYFCSCKVSATLHCFFCFVCIFMLWREIQQISCSLSEVNRSFNRIFLHAAWRADDLMTFALRCVLPFHLLRHVIHWVWLFIFSSSPGEYLFYAYAQFLNKVEIFALFYILWERISLYKELRSMMIKFLNHLCIRANGETVPCFTITCLILYLCVCDVAQMH